MFNLVRVVCFLNPLQRYETFLNLQNKFKKNYYSEKNQAPWREPSAGECWVQFRKIMMSVIRMSRMPPSRWRRLASLKGEVMPWTASIQSQSSMSRDLSLVK